MIQYAETYHSEAASHGTDALSFLSEEELTAFSLLVDHRRSLPIFLGDCWRCYACRLETPDFMAMARHILDFHDPAPWNDEDRAEWWGNLHG